MIGTIRELTKLGRRDAIAYDGLCALADLVGFWKHPARASGDLEDMRFLDKVYWMYKTERPVRHPVRGSGLAEYFAASRPAGLPAGFVAEREATLAAVGDLMPHP